MSKFRVGEDVIFRNNQHINSLTSGKLYKVEKIDYEDDTIYVINDTGRLSWYSDYRFDLNIKEQRKQKLNKIYKK